MGDSIRSVTTVLYAAPPYCTGLRLYTTGLCLPRSLSAPPPATAAAAAAPLDSSTLVDRCARSGHHAGRRETVVCNGSNLECPERVTQDQEPSCRQQHRTKGSRHRDSSRAKPGPVQLESRPDEAENLQVLNAQSQTAIVASV